MSFAALGLSPRLERALENNHYKEPSPIQKKAIPVIAKGLDVMACAQTGTGKTAAFSLPLIDRIVRAGEKWRRTTVLILTPTRELACQVVENIQSYSQYVPVRCEAIYGGVPINNQIRQLRKGVNIIVATPGRLLDHVKQRTLDLSDIETLVLDEADRMLDMGFVQDVKRIVSLLPKTKRQTLLFSATFSTEIKALASTFLRQPQVIQVAKENTVVTKIAQVLHPVEKRRRRELLSHLIREGKWQQVLVFTRTKRGANFLAEKLTDDGHQTMAIHGNKSQSARMHALKTFKEGKTKVLVATDIAARGIDIQALPYVVNFDLPEVAENYVHRIGRTGRAGKVGQAVSFASMEDLSLLRAIEGMTKQAIPRQLIPGFEPDLHAKEALMQPFESKKNRSKSAKSSKSFRTPATTHNTSAVMKVVTKLQKLSQRQLLQLDLPEDVLVELLNQQQQGSQSGRLQLKALGALCQQKKNYARCVAQLQLVG